MFCFVFALVVVLLFRVYGVYHRGHRGTTEGTKGFTTEGTELSQKA